jgi:hypothetical protein
LEFTDVEANVDGYSILDFNNGLVSVGSGNDLLSMEGDPEVTFADPSWASGSFSVLDCGLGGTFQFKVERVFGTSLDFGGLYVRARTEVFPGEPAGVAEPSSSIIFILLGLVGLAIRRRS